MNVNYALMGLNLHYVFIIKEKKNLHYVLEFEYELKSYNVNKNSWRSWCELDTLMIKVDF
jgi:hypothetical protein